MSAVQELQVSARMQGSLAELRGLILEHYPDAKFRVSRSPDDPEAVHLRAVVDVDDIDEVVDLVLERMMALQIEENLPVFVIPVRALEPVPQQPRRLQAESPPAGGPQTQRG